MKSTTTYGFEFEFQEGPSSVMEALDDGGHCGDPDCENCGPMPDRSGSGLPEGLILKEDGSVSGGEITTRGGQSIPECLSLFGRVLGMGIWEVDEGCSFHVHVGDTSFGQRFSAYSSKGKHIYQAEALTFLLYHWDQWPAGVKRRFLRDLRDDYFAFTFSGGKMQGIRVHPQGTMEYRLWGNISSVADAETVLRLTERAHRFALAVIHGETQGLWRPHMHDYFAGGRKGIEWILCKADVTPGRFVWEEFYKKGRAWSERVLKDVTGPNEELQDVG